MDITYVSHTRQVSPTVPDTQSSSGLRENLELIKSVQGINASQILGADSELTLAIDPQTRLPVVQIISRQTHQVVMQLPEEYILQLQQSLQRRPDSYHQLDSATMDPGEQDQSDGY